MIFGYISVAGVKGDWNLKPDSFILKLDEVWRYFTMTLNSVHRVFPEPPTLLLLLLPFLILLPPSGSRLQVPPTAVNQTMRVLFFLIPSVNRALQKLTALRGCCVNKLSTR